MKKGRVCIEIASEDVVMLTVALEERLATWRRTKKLLENVESVGEETAFQLIDDLGGGGIEECSSLSEARGMVELWEKFVDDVFGQLLGR